MKKLNNKLKQYLVYVIPIIIVIAFIILGKDYYYKYYHIMKDPNKIRDFIISYGRYSALVFIFMQIIQVVIFFIPGEIVQIAGGYIFGPIIGTILSLLGITIGSVIIYLIARKFGRPFVEKLVSKNKLKLSKKILNLKRPHLAIFIFYLIPGLPKDVFGYICGIVNISLKEFIIYSTLGRFPCIFISNYFGSKILSKDIKTLIIIACIMSVLFIVGVLKGDGIISKIVGKKSKKNKD